MAKPKLALYWAASCGGCEIAVLDTELKVLEIADFFDIVFWPCAMDFKYDDVRAMEDGAITLTLFNGAIRSSENYEIAKLLRKKSQVLCAFGSCASDGCIPGLANFTTLEEILRYVYEDSPSTVNGERVRPQPEYDGPRGDPSPAPPLEHRADPPAGGRRRLRHPRMPAAAGPDQARGRRGHRHPARTASRCRPRERSSAPIRAPAARSARASGT